MMLSLNLIVFATGMIALGTSLFWTTSRWNSRGGLKAPFFQDRLSRDVAIVTSGVLLISVVTVLAINVALLCSASADSAPLASHLVLFVLSSVLVSLADIEGCYGAGIFARKGSHLVRVEWGDIVPGQGKVLVSLEGNSRERYYPATKGTLAAMDFGLPYGLWERISQARFDELPVLFNDDAEISLPNTRETFESLSRFIAFIKAYPGSWQAEVIRVCPCGASAVSITKVSSRGKALSFYVTSYYEFRNGKVQNMEEYWGENGSPPDWRKDGKYTKVPLDTKGTTPW